MGVITSPSRTPNIIEEESQKRGGKKREEKEKAGKCRVVRSSV